MKKNLILSLFALITFNCFSMEKSNLAGLQNSLVQQDNRFKELNRKLKTAVKANDLGEIKNLINSGALIANINKAGQSLLHYAINYGQIEAVRLLISLGANVNGKDSSGKTPLHFAAIKGDALITLILLKHNANISLKDNLDRTPLSYASNLKIVKLLLESGGNVNDKNDDGLTLLHKAVNALNLKTISFLLKENPDMTIQDGYGYSFLFFRPHCNIGDNKKILKAAQLLIDHGAPLNVCNELGDTPLHSALRQGVFNLVKLLLKRGAKTNIRNNKGDTPLSLAINLNSQYDLLKLLITYGSRVDNINKHGINPLLQVIRAETKEFIDLVILFLSAPEIINFTNSALKEIMTKINKATNNDKKEDYEVIKNMLLQHLRVYDAQGLISTSGINGGTYNGNPMPILPLEILAKIASEQFQSNEYQEQWQEFSDYDSDYEEFSDEDAF